jgi:prevent-host-death family protein
MKVIPHRVLRNESGRVLREAEAGERFIVTVDGRPVATVAPVERRAFVPIRDLRTALAPTRPDRRFLRDARALGGRIRDIRDPWTRKARKAR